MAEGEVEMDGECGEDEIEIHCPLKRHVPWPDDPQLYPVS